jgi:hypothetical protein
MSEQIIMDAMNIDTSVFTYSTPKAHASGGKVVNLYDKRSKEALTIYTPLILTWGAQEGLDQSKNPTGKFTMALQFPNADFPNPDCDAFLKSMQTLERKIKSDAMKNSKEWFGKVINSEEVMDEKFNVMLRYPKIQGTLEPNLAKAPTLTVKIPCWNGSWKTEIYDHEYEPLYINGSVNTHLSPLEYLKPKTYVSCLLQCGGLWFVNGKVSITWNLKQAVVQKPREKMEGKCFIKLKAADRAVLESLPPPEDTGLEVGVSAMVIDSDDEGESEPSYPVQTSSPLISPSDFKEQPVQETVSAVVEEELQASAATAEQKTAKKKITRKKSTEA